MAAQPKPQPVPVISVRVGKVTVRIPADAAAAILANGGQSLLWANAARLIRGA